MNKEEFEMLNPSEKQNLMLKISAAHPQFKFLNLTTFRCGSDSFETGVFDFEGSEFVFIPSGEPVLGWNDFAVLDEISAAKIKEQCEFCGSEQSLREYVAQQTSPLRRAKIPAMLAERRAGELSWVEVDAELEANLQKDGFSLPNEDEWEYLAGCGARTLWRFGDEPDPSEVALPHENQPKNPKFSLFEPNLFGLFIASDPYAVEIVSAPAYFKGGDGGCAFCGGASFFESLLPASPFYAMDEAMRQDHLDFLSGGELDSAIYRRIFRLERELF